MTRFAVVDTEQTEQIATETCLAGWQLVERVQGGDQEAFGLLYDRYVSMIYRFVDSRVRDRHIAEDITSDTFLRALRSIHSITYRGQDLGAWLVTIARNLVFDHAKSARVRLERATADHPEDLSPISSAESIALETFTSLEIAAALGRLSEPQRTCITLRFLNELSLKETAAAMGSHEGAIKSLQHRAIRALTSLLDAEALCA